MDIEESFKSFAISLLNCGSLFHKSLYTCRTTSNYSPASVTGGPEKQGGSVTSHDVVRVNQLSRMHFCSPSCMKSFLSVPSAAVSIRLSLQQDVSKAKLQTRSIGVFSSSESEFHSDTVNKLAVNIIYGNIHSGKAGIREQLCFHFHFSYILNEPLKPVH